MQLSTKPVSRFVLVLSLAALPVLAGQVSGIKNFAQVDDHVYRGGQPSAEGLKYLAGIGVKVVLDLREGGSRSLLEEKLAIANGMKYVNIPMSGLTPPTDAQITKALTILEDPNGGPVFVHCKRGADRTGAVIAAYHIDHEKWPNQRALEDAMAHGMSSFQLPRQRFIRMFQARTVEAAASQAVDAPVAAAGAIVKN